MLRSGMTNPLWIVLTTIALAPAACRDEPRRLARHDVPAATPRPSDAATAPVAERMEIIPGTSIGPVLIGMPSDMIAKVSPLHGVPGATADTIQLGPYLLSLDAAGAVRQVEVTIRGFPGGLRCLGHDLPAAPRDLAEVAAALPQCAPPEVLEGETRIVCNQGKVVIHRGSAPDSEIGLYVARVEVPRPPMRPAPTRAR